MWLTGGAFGATAPELRDFAFDPKPGGQMPLQVMFWDEQGIVEPLREILGEQPAIIAFGYFKCPNLCGLLRADLFHALAGTGLTAGHDYNLAIISIDPAETSKDASDAKARDIDAFSLRGAASWRYLTGSADAIE